MKAAGDGDLVIIDPEGESVHEQLMVLLNALKINAERQTKYGDNWKRKGWRGALFGARLALERSWDYLWDADPQGFAKQERPPIDVDDLLDTINYAAMVIRGINENNRDGEWWKS